jgi:hypothetical protein
VIRAATVRERSKDRRLRDTRNANPNFGG